MRFGSNYKRKQAKKRNLVAKALSAGALSIMLLGSPISTYANTEYTPIVEVIGEYVNVPAGKMTFDVAVDLYKQGYEILRVKDEFGKQVISDEIIVREGFTFHTSDTTYTARIIQTIEVTAGTTVGESKEQLSVGVSTVTVYDDNDVVQEDDVEVLAGFKVAIDGTVKIVNIVEPLPDLTDSDGDGFFDFTVEQGFTAGQVRDQFIGHQVEFYLDGTLLELFDEEFLVEDTIISVKDVHDIVVEYEIIFNNSDQPPSTTEPDELKITISPYGLTVRQFIDSMKIDDGYASVTVKNPDGTPSDLDSNVSTGMMVYADADYYKLDVFYRTKEVFAGVTVAGWIEELQENGATTVIVKDHDDNEVSIDSEPADGYTVIIDNIAYLVDVVTPRVVPVGGVDTDGDGFYDLVVSQGTTVIEVNDQFEGLLVEYMDENGLGEILENSYVLEEGRNIIVSNGDGTETWYEIVYAPTTEEPPLPIPLNTVRYIEGDTLQDVLNGILASNELSVVEFLNDNGEKITDLNSSRYKSICRN